jgi:hypothetical protein
MKGHHTPNIWQGKISLKTRQICGIQPVGALSVRDEAVPDPVRGLSESRYD